MAPGNSPRLLSQTERLWRETHAQAPLPWALKEVSGEEPESGWELEMGLAEVSGCLLITSLRLRGWALVAALAKEWQEPSVLPQGGIQRPQRHSMSPARDKPSSVS